MSSRFAGATHTTSPATSGYFRRELTQLGTMATTENHTANMTASVTYPVFNERNIKNWFVQLEAIFSVRKITSQAIKFATLVPALPPSIVDEVADILESVREHEPRAHLKEAILERTGRSDETHFEHFFGISPDATKLHPSFYVM